jgi:hypothetical protein
MKADAVINAALAGAKKQRGFTKPHFERHKSTEIHEIRRGL